MTKRKQANDALRDQLAARFAAAPPAEDETPLAATPAAPLSEDATAEALAHFGGGIEPLTRGRAIIKLAVTTIAPAPLEALLRQPRRLPPIDELRDIVTCPPILRPLRDELISLGESLRAGQVAPVVVYAVEGPPPYRLLVGERRWTAAQLVGLTTLDAVVVSAPDPLTRLRAQVAENAQRADLTDMERAWALVDYRAALTRLGEEPSWGVVEEELGYRHERATQLRRLLSFSEHGQTVINRLRLREQQLVPLHSVLRAGNLTPVQADELLERLADQVALRITAAPNPIDDPARLVSRAAVAALLPSERPGPAADLPKTAWARRVSITSERAAAQLREAARKIAKLTPEDRHGLDRRIAQLEAALRLFRGGESASDD